MPEETPTTDTHAAPAETGKTFSEDYVKTLRTEAGGYRTQLRAEQTAREAAEARLAEVQTGLPEATSRAEAAERRAMVLEVALDKGLSATLVPRLQGSTREEIEADADALAALLNPTPVGPLDYGAGNTGDPAAKDDPISNVNAALHAVFRSRG